MPCYDPETHKRPERLERKVHELTAMLCFCCRSLPVDIIKSNQQLADWWYNHEIHDRRIAELKLKSEQFGDESLTPEERGELYFANDISYQYDFPKAILLK